MQICSRQLKEIYIIYISLLPKFFVYKRASILIIIYRSFPFYLVSVYMQVNAISDVQEV